MKKFFPLLLIIIVGLSSCGTEEPIPTYTLTAISIPNEAGKINFSPQSLNYKEGEVVTLTPEPNEY